MFISLKSLSLISSLIVLTSATPIARSSQISCKNGGTSEGNTLQWKDRHSRDVGNVAFNGQRDGQGRQNMVTLAADGSPAAPQGFNFWGCDGADSLGYPKGSLSNGSGYGQLRPANAPHHWWVCLIFLFHFEYKNFRLIENFAYSLSLFTSSVLPFLISKPRMLDSSLRLVYLRMTTTF